MFKIFFSKIYLEIIFFLILEKIQKKISKKILEKIQKQIPSSLVTSVDCFCTTGFDGFYVDSLRLCESRVGSRQRSCITDGFKLNSCLVLCH
jgi:hypothetical protein